MPIKTNYGTIKLISYTPEPVRVISMAAKMCVQPGTGTQLYHELDNSNISLVQRLSKRGHHSVLEHAVFTLSFEDVSVFAEQFIIEFRLASYTVKSRRYVNFSNSGTIMPNSILNNAELQSDYDNHIKFLFSEYDYFCESGIPKEDARFVLPYCFKSNFVCTMNLRELVHLVDSCLYGHGCQFAELKDLGWQIISILDQIIPGIYTHPSQPRDSNSRINDLIGQALADSSSRLSNQAIGEVDLLDYTSDGESLLASLALRSKVMLAPDRLEAFLRAHQQEIIEEVVNSQRSRELEHLKFTFRISGMSLPILTHLTRHRIQSLSVSSLMLNTNIDRYIIPPTIEKDSSLLTRYIQVFELNSKMYNKLVGMGIPREDMVYLFLSGNLADVVTTMNARQLKKFFALRCCRRAQWEIRRIAYQMLNQLRKLYPQIFNHMGAACLETGLCPEGEHGCGKPFLKN